MQYNVRCTFLDLYQLRAAIPCTWKRLLINPKNKDQESKPKKKRILEAPLDISQASSKRIYNFLLLHKLPPIAFQRKWTEIFPDFQPEDNPPAFWKEIYTSPYRTTRDTKFQAFQFKLIHCVLPCNRYLYNQRIKESDTCSYCKGTDDLQHFFWSCPSVEAFWHKIENWLELNANIHSKFNVLQTIFGLAKTDPQAKVITFISLFAKHFIYRQKLFYAGQLEIIQFLRELRLKLSIEKYICTKENKLRKFACWNMIFNALG